MRKANRNMLLFEGKCFYRWGAQKGCANKNTTYTFQSNYKYSKMKNAYNEQCKSYDSQTSNDFDINFFLKIKLYYEM